jgi:hypothetical protein
MATGCRRVQGDPGRLGAWTTDSARQYRSITLKTRVTGRATNESRTAVAAVTALSPIRAVWPTAALGRASRNDVLQPGPERGAPTGARQHGWRSGLDHEAS